MKVSILYEYESACGAKIRHRVIATSNEELTEYIKRLVKAQYKVLDVVVESV